jgi:TRAP-type uncharacterized transport system substrate-binding protein
LNMMLKPRTLALCLIATSLASACHVAAKPAADANRNVVSLLAGEPAWLAAATAIAQRVAHRDGLQVMAVQGEGCVSSVADLLQLERIDAALLMADCVAYAERQTLLPQATAKVAYIARVEQVPLLLLTRRDYASVTALAGKRIATGTAYSAGFATGELLLGGIGLPFQRVPKSGVAALAALRSGEADAVLLHGPALLEHGWDTTAFHVIGLAAAQDTADVYSPAIVPADKLQGLAAADVETLSTGLVLVARQAKSTSSESAVQRFAAAYVSQVFAGEDAHHLAARVPGLPRLKAASTAVNTLYGKGPADTSFEQGDGQ